VVGQLTQIYKTSKETEIQLAKAEKAEGIRWLKLAFSLNMSHWSEPYWTALRFTELLKEPKLTGKKQQNILKLRKR
jgi:hypothetical protein